jgi:hypothetical protein
MHRKQQDVFLVPHPQQFHAEQRSALEIEWPAGFFARHLVRIPIAGIVRERSQIDCRNLHLRRWRDSLKYMPVRSYKVGPKCLMPRNDLRDGAIERLSV